MTNKLYYGDNLPVLRESIASESVDLIYLDPPFNSNASYNVLFKAPSGEQSQAQIEAFEDTWHWNELAVQSANTKTSTVDSDAKCATPWGTRAHQGKIEFSFRLRRLPLHFEMRRRLRGNEKSCRLKVLGCCTSRRNSGTANSPPSGDTGPLQLVE